MPTEEKQRCSRFCTSADFKMDVYEENNIINYYVSLTESVERLVSFFDGNKLERYVTIQQHVIDCCRQIDTIITLETHHDSFLALYQQKQQFTLLLEMIEKLVHEELQINTDTQFTGDNSKFQDNERYQIPKESKKLINNQLESVVESSMVKPKIHGFKEIIGLHDIKKVLKSLVILPRTQPQLFHNRRICNSILLYGPPGTGKTRLTHALAAEANAVFHCISAGDILSHYVGQTEKTIKSLFQNLKAKSEFSILFIDEIDAFGRKRSESEQEHTRRIKTEFMCQMSSVEDCTNIIVVCATNCPWDLDTAILRRLQKRIYVPLPNNFERLEFFRFLTNNVHFDDALIEWNLLVQKTDGYSGSDLFDVVQTAMTVPLNELEDTKIWKCCDDGFFEPVLGEQDFSNVVCSELNDLPSNSVRARKVHLNDLLNAVDSVKCTVTQDDIKKFERFNRV